MSGVVSQAGSRSGVVGHMSDVVLLRKDRLPSSGAWAVKDLFRPEFKTYEFVFHIMKMGDDNVNLRFRFSTDNGSNYISSTNYHSQAIANVNGARTSPVNDQGVDGAIIGGYGNQGANANEASSGHVWVYDPMNTTSRKHWRSEWVIWKYDGEIQWSAGAGAYESSDVMNACQFYPSGGDFDVGATSYGAVSIYGYR